MALEELNCCAHAGLGQRMAQIKTPSVVPGARAAFALTKCVNRHVQKTASVMSSSF
jgi:hypothetical protein